MVSPKTRLTIGALVLAASAPAILAAHPARNAKAPPPAAAPVPALSAETCAAALVKAMTREEKLQLVHGFFPPRATGRPGAPTDMIPSAGHVPPIERLGIPALRQSDASLGVANQVEQRKGDVATALPAGLATAATFDPDFAYRGGAMIGSEARAKRFNVLLAGGVNLTRDPWNGRNFEYLGEDPLLAGVMAGAAIRGVQSNHIVSTIKHFALNSQETGRMLLDARIGEAALRESDLLAFQIAIEQGHPGSVMCAYNLVNGDYACENARLLTDVLRRDWGFKGWVMSDWGGVHSTVKAARAGLDHQSGQELDTQLFFGPPLAAAIADGSVPEARLDEMTGRILTGMIENGLLDHPMPATAQTIDYATNAVIAQQTAEAGIVLLKNERGILPLTGKGKRIVLIGGHADVGVLSGGGSSQVRSVGGAPIEIRLTSGAAASFARVTHHASSPMAAIRKLAPDADVSFVDGSDPVAAAAAAKDADVAIIFATQWQTEAQDAETLVLPDNQDALIAAVVGANRNTVVVLETGGPVLMPWLDRVDGVIEAWYPGQRGGEAIADILFGAVNPSGHLPITFPRSADQAPRPEPVGLAALKRDRDLTAASNAADAGPAMASFPVEYREGSDVGYRWYAAKRETPLFPFGHGLSYTRFAYSNLKVSGGAALTVSFDVTNAGDRAGADVPQVYVANIAADRPARLMGWQRVTLKPGERRHVTITAEPRIVAGWDVAGHGWHVAGGRYQVAVAHHAGDAALTAETVLADRRFGP